MIVEQRGALLPQLRPADGEGQFFVRSDYTWGLVASFTAPPWHRDGRTPVFWRYQYDPDRRRYTLFLVAAPQVQLTRVDVLTSSLPLDLFPSVVVIRARDADRVPEIEAPFHVDQFLGRPEWVINGVDPDSEDYTDLQQFIVRTAMVPDFQKALVRPRANGVTIEHALNHWRVDIYVPWDAPAAFAYEIVRPTGFDPFAGPTNVVRGAAQFRIRVVYTSNVIVEGFVTRTFVGEEILSTVALDEAVVPLGNVPHNGSDLSKGYMLRPFTGFRHQLSPRSKAQTTVVELWVGLIPIVGTVADVAHVAYKAGTGQSIWGETVTADEIRLEGAFALLGTVSEVHDATKLLRGISDRLFPGAKLVK